MANASGLAIDNLKADTYVHKPSGVTYSISAAGGKATLAYRDARESSTAGERALSYFLGSGHLGVTYLYSIDHYLFESPVAWYAASRSYDMKPGLAEMREKPPALPMQSNCMRCHMSAVQPSDDGTINRYDGLPFLHSGITCEACHGDSESHVRTKGNASIVNPARLDPARRDSVCISCHLEGDVSVERAGHSALNYRPGDSISTYMAYYVYGGANPSARGVSEVEQLSQSTCKRASGDKMSCTSCHDPHYTPALDQRAAFYRNRCLACHAEPSFAASHHRENQDCTSCHMPRTGADNIPHVAWTDHRILRLPAEDLKVQSHDPTPNELRPIFSPAATKRDLAMAYYQVMLEGSRSFEPAAWEGLTSQKATIANDKDALDALGNVSAERGDGQMAEWSFRRVLEVDPADLTALSNLGILLAKQGKLDEAIALLRPAFDRNRDISGLAMNLARIECMAGHGASAQATLQATLVYNPDLSEVQRLLSQMTGCGSSGGKE
jgi:predicted CXXCH cytochrome family protein